jgi:hypothetical protein
MYAQLTSQFKHENVIKIAGVLGVAPELRLTAKTAAPSSHSCACSSLERSATVSARRSRA